MDNSTIARPLKDGAPNFIAPCLTRPVPCRFASTLSPEDGPTPSTNTIPLRIACRALPPLARTWIPPFQQPWGTYGGQTGQKPACTVSHDVAGSWLPRSIRQPLAHWLFLFNTVWRRTIKSGGRGTRRVEPGASEDNGAFLDTAVASMATGDGPGSGERSLRGGDESGEGGKPSIKRFFFLAMIWLASYSLGCHLRSENGTMIVRTNPLMLLQSTTYLPPRMLCIRYALLCVALLVTRRVG